MKQRSVMFDSCWGLAFAALAPLVIGTDLVTTPSAHAATMLVASGGGDGEPDGWPDPCLVDPESDQCTFFLEWLGIQEDVWTMLWDVPYVHGKSTMSIDISGVSYPHGVLDVAVWHNADLDYEDPDLTEEEVLDQIVAEGIFDVAVAYEIASEDDAHIDPDTGTETFVQMTVFVVAGTLIGETLLDAHVLGVINRSHITNSLGDEQTMYNFGLIDRPGGGISVVMDMAEQIWTASQGLAALPPDTPGGPDGPGSGPGSPSGPIDQDGNGPDRDPPCDQCYPCQWATHPDAPPMTEACCACFGTYGSNSPCFESCRQTFNARVWACLGIGVGAAGGCMWKCMKPSGFLGPLGIKGCGALCGTVGIAALVGCIAGARALRKSCEADCLVDRNQCLIDQGCPDLIP